ncbi:MAG: YncE family protein [Pirellulales bacterium]
MAAISGPWLRAEEPVTYPPRLPGGEAVVTDSSGEFLRPAGELREGVVIAATPPTIDFLYYPGQDYAGNPWSNWGDSLAVGDRYYASIGDHLAPAGNGYVFEYDPKQKSFRKLLDLKKLLNMPEGHYAPAKIHSRIDLGSDGWLYCSTHRGSTKVTSDEYHYQGDWVVRCHPQTGEAEVVVQGPVPKHCIPTSVLDPQRLIFYGGTAEGTDAPDKGVRFFAYDIAKQKVLYTGPDGPARYLIFAPSTGRVYFLPGSNDDGQLLRFDPKAGGPPVQIEAKIGLRAATQETSTGKVYSVSTGQGKNNAMLWEFDSASERSLPLGEAAVGKQSYIASMDADQAGRYLYYVPGAHGGSEQDGAAVVQFDTRTKQRKVIAFLHPFYQQAYGCTLKGTYSTALSPTGDKLYVTWNASRGTKVWDCCALTVIHIPESERLP